ncbi:hypothetical protein GCM10026988_40710 [Vibrio panuliri]
MRNVCFRSFTLLVNFMRRFWGELKNVGKITLTMRDKVIILASLASFLVNLSKTAFYFIINVDTGHNHL